MTTPAPPDDAVLVQTVLGPVPVGELGVTLTHEHLLSDLVEAHHGGTWPWSSRIASTPVGPQDAWLLREDPYASADNVAMTASDVPAVAAELELFAAAGGRTVVDNTTGRARRPALIRELSRRTGLNVVMGGGWSLAHGLDDVLAPSDVDRLAAELVAEVRVGVEVPGEEPVKVGVIGEIGVGPRFTASERVTLQAACLAQLETGLPLLVHLPGWQRRGLEVLDVTDAMGVDPGSVVLCHLDPSGKDARYQRELAGRGAWLELDMIGMPHNFPGEGQSPSVEDTLIAVAGLVADRLADRLLLSQDVFLKTMWTRNGGNGYAFVPTVFLPRLEALGVPPETVASFLTSNPAALFTHAAQQRTRSA